MEGVTSRETHFRYAVHCAVSAIEFAWTWGINACDYFVEFT